MSFQVNAAVIRTVDSQVLVRETTQSTMPMNSVSNSIVFAQMLQNQHFRRAWKFLRPVQAAQQEDDATGSITPPCPSPPNSRTEWPAGQVENKEHPAESQQEHCEAEGLIDSDLVLQNKSEIDAAPDELRGVAERAYDFCIFEEEEVEGDYTSGPCRLMLVRDVDKDSVALMLKYDLSARIKRAIQAQRVYQKSQAHAELELEEIDRFEDDVRKVISDKDLRLFEISPEREKVETGESEAEDAAITSLRRELDVLRHVLSNMKTRKQIVNNRLHSYAEHVQQSQAEMMEYFDAVFTDALLVGPSEDETQQVEVIDLDTEFRDMSRELYRGGESRGGYTPEPLTTETIEWQTRDAIIQTPEEKAKAECENMIWEAREARDHAERQFDTRRDRRDQEWQDHRIAEFNGLATNDASQEAFDLRWIINDRLTARTLIEAGETLAKAKAAAAEAGIEILDPEYNIPEYAWEFPGYPVGLEEEVGAFTPDSAVDAWMDTMAEVASASDLQREFVETSASVARVDYWDFHEPEIGDSESCVDMDLYREDIDKWQKAWPASKVSRSNSL